MPPVDETFTGADKNVALGRVVALASSRTDRLVQSLEETTSSDV